jgi:hypothetical protein
MFIASSGINAYRKALIAEDDEEVPTEEMNMQACNDLLLSCQEDTTFGNCG